MIIGIYGYHDSGKTHFLEKIMEELKTRNITAAAIKHLGTKYQDDSSKDTGRLAEAGYKPVIGIAADSVLIRNSDPLEINQAISLVKQISNADIIFVEGFKNAPIDKIAIGDVEELPGTVMKLRKVDSAEFERAVEYIVNRVLEEKG